MNKLRHKRIENLSTDGKEGWEQKKKIFRRDVIAVMMKARGRERGNACSFIRTLP